MSTEITTTDYERKLRVLSGQIAPRGGAGLGPGIANSVNRGINKLNWLRLKQPVSNDPRCPKGTEDGVLYSNGEAYPDGPDITLIHVHFVRRYTEEKMENKKRVFESMCSSIDSVHGRSWKDIHPEGEVRECEGCPFTIKEQDPKEAFARSKCSIKYAFIGIVGDLEGLVQFEIGGGSYFTGKNLVEQAIGDPDGIWTKSYTLGSVKEGAYYSWDVVSSQRNSDEIQMVAEKLNELYTEKYEEARKRVSDLVIREISSSAAITSEDLEGSDEIPFA